MSEELFLKLMNQKLMKTMVEPGEPVGMLCAQVGNAADMLSCGAFFKFYRDSILLCIQYFRFLCCDNSLESSR